MINPTQGSLIKFVAYSVGKILDPNVGHQQFIVNPGATGLFIKREVDDYYGINNMIILMNENLIEFDYNIINFEVISE